MGIDTPVSLLDIAGATPFMEAHGISYKGLLDQSVDSVRDNIMYQTFRMNDGAKEEFTPVPERGIRNNDWLYVRQPQSRKFLFDQHSDPNELNNLANNSQYEDLMDKFDAEINHHMANTGDAWEIAADFAPPDFLTHEAAKELLINELLPCTIEVP